MTNTPEMLIWCSLCNSRPSDGILEVLFEGQLQTTKIQACTPCVIGIKDEQWLKPDDLVKDKT